MCAELFFVLILNLGVCCVTVIEFSALVDFLRKTLRTILIHQDFQSLWPSIPINERISLQVFSSHSRSDNE